MKTRRPIRSFWKVLLAAVLPIALATVGSATAQGAGSAGAIRLEISMKEMAFSVDGGAPNAPIVLQAGQTYDIIFRNTGTVTHEAQFGREPNMESGVAHDYTVFLFSRPDTEIVSEAGYEIESSEEEGLVEVKLDPGEEAEVIVTVPVDAVGEWELGCFLPGHYQEGMHAPVTVE